MRFRQACVPFALALATLLLPAAVRAAADAFAFRTRVDYGAWTAPFHVALGDVNNDGILDMAVANSGVSSITLRLGAADGTFLGLSFHVVSYNPRWVTLADLNRDGNLDMASANTGTNTVSVLIGDGQGGFAGRVDYATRLAPSCVIAADMTGDGNQDLVVTSYGLGGYVEVLAGDGAGGFGAGLALAVGSAPFSASAADLNSDGVLDLVVADHVTAAAFVLLGTGGASFAQPVAYATPSPPWCVVTGDLNGDGHVDFVTANDTSPTVSVFTGEGDGLFTHRGNVPCGSYPYSVAIGDLDGDGIPDLAATNDVSHTITVLRGTGDGTFEGSQSLPTRSTPISVALGDVDRNGSLDMVIANYNHSSSSVYLNDLQGSLPTSVALAAEPPSSTYGQAVRLTATVSPDTVRGVVEFLDGGVTVGSAPVVAGVASLELTGLVHREHLFRARYGGSSIHLPGTSGIVPHFVALAGTALALESSASATIQYVKVRFLATVSATPPGSGTPAGSVVFRVDGAPLGAPAALVSGVATSDSTYFTSIGVRQVSAEYVPADTLRFTGSDAVLSLPVGPADPVIVAVRDVPNDQGGKVFLTWRCAVDSPVTRWISGYRVWRRVPNPDVAIAARPGAPLVLRRPAGAGSANETFWEAIADLPAAALVSYGYTAPTTQDSMAGSNPYTAYFIQALTREPDSWFQSEPDSGYSVDNLSPATPAPFVANYSSGLVTLHWGPSRDADFREFRLHRGSDPLFVPAPVNLIMAGPDTGFVDATGSPSVVYKLAAVDVHGNVSRVATVQTDRPVAALAALVRAEATSSRIELTWYSGGNPGLLARVERRTAERDWEPVGVIAADGEGFLRYDDEAVTPGVRYGYRLAILDGGSEVYAGTAWVTAENPAISLGAAWPNPLSGGPLRLRVALSSAERARIEILDVTGRRVATREVGPLGAGHHEVQFTEAASLPAGVYHARLSRGTTVVSQRFVIIR